MRCGARFWRHFVAERPRQFPRGSAVGGSHLCVRDGHQALPGTGEGCRRVPTSRGFGRWIGRTVDAERLLSVPAGLRVPAPSTGIARRRPQARMTGIGSGFD